MRVIITLEIIVPMFSLFKGKFHGFYCWSTKLIRVGVGYVNRAGAKLLSLYDIFSEHLHYIIYCKIIITFLAWKVASQIFSTDPLRSAEQGEVIIKYYNTRLRFTHIYASIATGITSVYSYYGPPDSKVPGANMGAIWVLWAPCWPHELCCLGLH